VRAPFAAGLAAGVALVTAGHLILGDWVRDGSQSSSPPRDSRVEPAQVVGAQAGAANAPSGAMNGGADGRAPIPPIAPLQREPLPSLPTVGGGWGIVPQAGASRSNVDRRARVPDRRTRVPRRPPSRVADEGIVVRALDRERRPVFSPSFASNGTAMFFHGEANVRTALMAAEEESPGDLRVMTIVDDGAKNYHVRPSPDDRQIAFDSDRDGERGVYIANRDGTEVRRVSGSGYAAVPTWSPDGQRLAFIRAEAANPKVWNLWLLSLQSSTMRRLTAFRYGQTWSASWFGDGERIAFAHEDRLIVQHLTTGREREYKTPIRGRLVRTPAVSPDGARVIFQVYRDGAWLLELTDGAMRRVLTDPSAEEFAWSRDGRRVAFHSRRDGEWGIWVLGGV
jgi:Tol biopolymer transport system component